MLEVRGAALAFVGIAFVYVVDGFLLDRVRADGVDLSIALPGLVMGIVVVVLVLLLRERTAALVGALFTGGVLLIGVAVGVAITDVAVHSSYAWVLFGAFVARAAWPDAVLGRGADPAG